MNSLRTIFHTRLILERLTISTLQMFYIRANRCSSLYDDIFALSGWKKEEINGIEIHLCSCEMDKGIKAERLEYLHR